MARPLVRPVSEEAAEQLAAGTKARHPAGAKSICPLWLKDTRAKKERAIKVRLLQATQCVFVLWYAWLFNA